MYKSQLNITDLPRDKLQALGKLRTVLVGTFNKAREKQSRMTLLKEVLKTVHAKIVEFEKEEAKAKEVADAVKDAELRKDTLEVAESVGINLDERLSTEKLVASLEAKILASSTDDNVETDTSS